LLISSISIFHILIKLKDSAVVPAWFTNTVTIMIFPTITKSTSTYHILAKEKDYGETNCLSDQERGFRLTAESTTNTFLM
jgi:hypothetical protein